MPFKLIDRTPIESLNIEVQHYEHIKTGAVHYHLACDHDEKVFMVAVRTMPDDSTGVAHILEHTALCGSEKYPVRDPFFMMTRRSLNTFMNAMTSSDWTAYPFASQNDKDFNNLLDVYLDAVFFSRLHELDFAQEGHRVEFSEAENTSSPLEYKGVVFNEMKGAMSSPVSQLWQGISSYLFPTTTYHHNSGGEPNCITDLTYEQLLEFYRTHYHPSNAIFMTFGNLDVEDVQRKFEEQALSRFEKQDKRWSVPFEKRYPAPIAVEQHYALDGEDLSKSTHHVMGWLLGDSTDLDAQLEAHLVSQILLDNSASPLRKALEKTPLAGSPSPLCGLEDSNREMSFLCGVSGSEPEHALAIEELILTTLENVVKDGVDSSIIEAALHQLELHQREIGGDHYPYGLQLMMNALSAAVHYGDPVSLINLEPALASLREKAQAPNFIQDAVQRLLLDNQHRVRFTLRPDNKISQRVKDMERATLDAMAERFTEEEKQAVVERTKALEERQASVDDAGILPQVTLDDIKPEVAYVAPTAKHDHAITATEYVVGTNGLIYQQLIGEMPALSAEQLNQLPFFTLAWTEVGAAGNDYLTQQQRQTASLGSLSAYVSLKPKVDDSNQLLTNLVMSGKALANKANDFTQIVKETWQAADFKEEDRLVELLNQIKTQREQSITGQGHGLAMSLAAAPLSKAASASDALAGLPQIKQLKDWLAQAESNPSILSQSLSGIAQTLSDPTEALIIHDEQGASLQRDALFSAWPNKTSTKQGEFSWEVSEKPTYWLVDSQVNFCAWALPTVTMEHPDAPVLAVLSAVLRNGFLHTAIREKGGAYGAGATQDSAMGCFKFFSYRDPRVEGTFDDFRGSVDWVLKQSSGDDLVEQAILGLIGSMDRPGSPAGEARQFFHLDRNGRTQAMRQQFRQGLLATTWKDVQRVAQQYIQGQEGSRAVVAPRGSENIAKNLGLIANDY